MPASRNLLALVAVQAAVQQAVDEENEFWASRARNPLAQVKNRATPLSAEVQRVGLRPSGQLAADAPIVQAVRRANSALGIDTKLDAASTDATRCRSSLTRRTAIVARSERCSRCWRLPDW